MPQGGEGESPREEETQEGIGQSGRSKPPVVEVRTPGGSNTLKSAASLERNGISAAPGEWNGMRVMGLGRGHGSPAREKPCRVNPKSVSCAFGCGGPLGEEIGR